MQRSSHVSKKVREKMRLTRNLLKLLLVLVIAGAHGITVYGATPYESAVSAGPAATAPAATASALAPLASTSSASRWEGVSLGTNLMLVGLSTGNLNLDFAINDHFSAGINFGLKAWPRWWGWDWDKNNDSRWKYIFVEPQIRWWHTYVFDGWYLGVNALWSHFNVGGPEYPFAWNYPSLKDTRMQGDFNAYGMFTGYSWWLARRLRLELEAGILLGRYNATRYQCIHCGAPVGQESGPVVIPKVGINLVVNFKERKQAQGDVKAFISGTNNKQ